MATSDANQALEPWLEVNVAITPKRFVNPIRAIVDSLNESNPTLNVIPLSIGDPTVFGNLNPAKNVVEAVAAALAEGKFNGYAPSTGYEFARQAIADSLTCPAAPVTAEDIVIASGGSGALDLAITCLAEEGMNILIPKPGFSLYKTLASAKGVQYRLYSCLPDRNWEADLDEMASLIDSHTAAIIITNPSNPCGSVFSEHHLRDILQVARTHRVPIIADEIYAGMVFRGRKFFPIASLTTEVPVLTVSGIAKRFLVPGWRLGWISIHDRNGLFAKAVRPGLKNLSQLILGANTLIQAALPDILANTPPSFFEHVHSVLEAHATLCFEALSRVRGLRPVMPDGAMYIMVGIELAEFKDIEDDRDFTRKLLKEQSVFCLPAVIFDFPNYFRIVTTVPHDKLQVALSRISDFCQAHRK